MSLHLGFLTHVHGEEPAPALYRRLVELFVAAEELGFDSGWVAQHHLQPRHGRLPSPLPLLAAVAARTTRIQLGTAVVVLPLENPLRLAEDAAVLDALSGGRLQLGLGTGGPSAGEFAAFGRDVADRRTRYAESLEILTRALSGHPLPTTPPSAGDPGTNGAGRAPAAASEGEEPRTLQPSGTGLASRLWGSTSRPEAAAADARAGRGLLLGVGPAGTVQRELSAAHSAAGSAPRAAVRGVFPGPDRATVAAQLAPDVARYLPAHVAAGWAPHDRIDTPELLGLMNVHYGTPDDIVASLRADPVVATSTHLIAAVQAESTTLDQALRHLEILAEDVAPGVKAP